MKAALKWIQNAVKQGLVPMECFTDDWNTYLARVASNPAYVYMFTAYANQQPVLGKPMPVPENGQGLPNYIRPQSTQGGNPLHTFCVFNTENVKNNMETLGKWLEWAAQPEYALTSYFGKEGIAWTRNDDGTISLSTQLYNNDWVAENFLDLGPDNAFFAVLTKEFYKTQYYDPEVEIEGTRAWSINSFYNACLPEWDAFVYSTTLEEDDAFRMGELQSVLRTFRKETLTRWLTSDADIDAEWDAYVTKMNELGAQEWLALKQKSYDKATGR